MGLAQKISQLEEAKIIRLFRGLMDSDDSFRGAGLHEPSKSLKLPNSEYLLKFVEGPGDRFNELVNWVYQVEYLPSSLWHAGEFDTFVEETLKRAFIDLRNHRDILESFDTQNTIKGRRTAFTFGDRFDYYLLTNICAPTTEENLESFSNRAHELFREMLNISDDLHPVFGLGTPETISQAGQGYAESFIDDLLHMPSSYYLVAREGEFSIAPMTEHGSFYTSSLPRSSETPPQGVSTTMTSALPILDHKEVPGLSDFETLLNSRIPKEADFQQLFVEYPHFLFGINGDYCEIKPHVCLFDPKVGRLVPDFMARIEDSTIWDVIELKLPNHPITVEEDGTERFSAKAARGISQLLQYRDFFGSKENRKRVADQFQTAPYEPCLTLVIGRGLSTKRYEWRNIRSNFPRVQVVSYDYVFDRAKECQRILVGSINSRTSNPSPEV